MEAWTSEISLTSDSDPWPPEQMAAAGAAARVCLQALGNDLPTEVDISQFLERGFDFARRYRPNLRGAAFLFTYYIGVEASPEEFEEIASKMVAACEPSGLKVTIQDYR